MRTTALAAAALALAFACREAPQQPGKATPARTARVPEAPAMNADEHDNLLNIAWGATVVSRTAELSLDNSALRAIDGDNDSSWNSPPSDGLQTLVFALPARARIDTIGARMPKPALFRVRTAKFETSLDGIDFKPLVTQTFKDFGEIQMFPVTPAEALYVRVTTTEIAGRFATFQSLQVRGKLLEQPTARPIAGCWTINGLPARVETHGGSVRGVIGVADPIVLDGGLEGPVYRFVWTKKSDFGFAAVSVTPDGKHLSGIKWHQEPVAYTFGDSWFGETAGCEIAGVGDASAATAGRFLDRIHRYPLYGLQFDETGRIAEAGSVTALDLLANLTAQPPSQRFRVVSREYRGASPDENRRRAQARLDSLRALLQKRGVDLTRIEFVAAGSDRPPQKIENEIMRVLYSVVDIERPVEGR